MGIKISKLSAVQEAEVTLITFIFVELAILSIVRLSYRLSIGSSVGLSHHTFKNLLNRPFGTTLISCL